MSMLVNLGNCIKRISSPGILPQLQKLTVNSLLPVCGSLQNYQPVRHKYKNQRFRNKRRHTNAPFWHAKVTRTLYPEHVTPENEQYIEDIIEEEYEEKRESMLDMTPFTKGEWNSKSQRVGLIGKKIGVYPMWLRDGKRILTTLVHISDNHVVRHIPHSDLAAKDHKDLARRAKKPRGALIVGSDSADPRLFTKEYYNMFSEAGVRPKKKLTKFLVTDNAVLAPGTPLYANHFRAGDAVDISNFTIDRGFQGVMKRWGFKGGPQGQGTTKNHRRGGYIGYGSRRGVLPGKKMPGHMGMEYRTLRGCKIVRVNSEFQCIWVMGAAVPGATGSYLNIYDSGLHHNRFRDPLNHPPFPTFFPEEDSVDEVDSHWEKVHPFSKESIVYEASK